MSGLSSMLNNLLVKRKLTGRLAEFRSLQPICSELSFGRELGEGSLLCARAIQLLSRSDHGRMLFNSAPSCLENSQTSTSSTYAVPLGWGPSSG